MGTLYQVTKIKPRTAAGYASESSVITLSNGNFVIAWQLYADTLLLSGNIHYRIANPSGVLLTNDTAVHAYTLYYTPDDGVPTGFALASGGFVLIWPKDHAPTLSDGSRVGMAQVFDANGLKVGGEISIPNVNNVDYGQFGPSLRSGSYSVVTADVAKVRAQYKNGLGVVVGTPVDFPVDTVSIGGNSVQVGVLNNNQVVVSWIAGTNLYTQVFTTDGTSVGGQQITDITPPAAITAGPIPYSVSALATGGFIVDFRFSYKTQSADTFGQLFDASGNKILSRFLLSPGGGSGDLTVFSNLVSGGFVTSYYVNSGRAGSGSTINLYAPIN